MAHRVMIDGVATPLDAAARRRLAPLRLHVFDGDHLAVICAAAASRDGAPITGNLAVVEPGEGALIRAGVQRVEIVWQAQTERLAAPASGRCRLCFGSFAADESAARCACNSWFHDRCDELRHNCPACGAARMAQP